MTGPWYLGRLAGFDLETTGVDVEADRIVTACVAQVGGKHPTRTATWLADPGIDIPEAAAAVHGITTEQVHAEGQPAGQVVEQVTAALAQVALAGIPIVAMNASYDLTLLDRECRRHRVFPLTEWVGESLRVIDPRVLDRRISHRRGPRTLTDLCQHYGVRIDGAHSAAADAIAACRVAWRIGATRPELAALPVEQLHQQQTAWAREQGSDLAAYFRRTPGKEHLADGVRTDWPLIPQQRSEPTS